MHNRNDSSDMDEVDVRKKKRKRSVSRDLSSELERSVGKQSLTSQSSAKKSTPQKTSTQEQGKTMLKLPLGNTMGALSSMRSIGQPSPPKRPRTSKSKAKPANPPPPSIIHVTGAVPTSVVSSVPQAISVHPGTLPGFPLHSATVARQVPLQNASAAALASAGRGQAFISLTAKNSDPGARVTQTFITIPRGSSPSVMTSNPAGGQTVQYIIKPQSQRHAPVSLSTVNAALSAQGGVVPSATQLPVRTIVSAPVRQTPLSQSPSSSFTSVVSLKGSTVTTQAPTFPPGAIPASNASLSATSLGKFSVSSAAPTSSRATFTRVGELTQPSTISVLTKEGNKLVMSQALSSAGLKGSYKLVSGAALQTVSSGTVLPGQSQVVVSHPVRPSTSGGSQKVVTQKGSPVQGNIVTSLPVSLAALAGKLPSNTVISQPSGRTTFVQSARTTTLSSQTVRTIPGQTVAAPANRVTNQPVNRLANPQSQSLSSVPAVVTVARAGTTQITRVISSGTPATSSQTESKYMAGKTSGGPVIPSQGTPKVAPSTSVGSSSTVPVMKVEPSPQVSTVGKVTTTLSGSIERRSEVQTTTVPTSLIVSSVPHTREVVPKAQVTTIKQETVVAKPVVSEQATVKTRPGASTDKQPSSS